jgi:hypothetical protein
MATVATKLAKSTVHYEEEVPTVTVKEWASRVTDDPKGKVCTASIRTQSS